MAATVELGWLLTLPQADGAWRWPCLVGALGTHAWLVVSERRRPTIDPRWLMWAAVLIAMAAVAIPPQGSHDVWSYAMYGRIVAAHHANPYTHWPALFPADPMSRHVDVVWRHTPSVYGPVFNAVSAAGALVYRASPLRAHLFYQLLSAGAYLGSVALLVRRRLAPWRIALIALAPVVIAAVNGAHNDVLVGFGVLAGLVLVNDRKWGSAGAVLGVATAVKLLGGPVAAGVVVALLLQRQWRAAATLGGSFTAVVAGCYLAAGGTRALQPLNHASEQLSRGSIMSGLHWFVAARHRLGSLPFLVNPAQRAQVATIAAAVIFLAVVWLTRRRPQPVELGVVALLAYLLAGPYILPWYAAAVVPALALVDRRTAWIGWSDAAVLQLGYVAATRDEFKLIPGSMMSTRLCAAGELVLIGLLVAAAVTARRHTRAPDAVTVPPQKTKEISPACESRTVGVGR